MITIRNQDMAIPYTARIGEAGIQNGMVVKFVVAAASGDPPKVVRAVRADLTDPTIKKGIVQFNFEDSQTVDFNVNVGSQTLTAISKTATVDDLCTVWTGKPIVGYHSSALDASITFASLREATRIGASGVTFLPGLYNSGATDGREVYLGWVSRMDGPEATISYETL